MRRTSMLRAGERMVLAGLGLCACYSPEVDEGSGTSLGAGVAMASGGAANENEASSDGRGAVLGSPMGAAMDSAEGSSAPVVEPVLLPAPCIGIPYQGQLEVRGGVGGPYVWTALSPLPAGLELDARTGAITGTPATDGRFSVAVRDAAEVSSAALELALERRQTCSFAYLASEGGRVRLHLRDVFLSSETNVTLPASIAADESVADFEFSPDGGWIALRIESQGKHRLAIYPTRADGGRAAEVTPLALCAPSQPQCTVLDYEWSASSEYLAVIVRDDAADDTGGDSLTGVRVASPTEPWSRLSTAAWDFGPVPLAYRGQLVWVASDWVAFMGADPGSSDVASEALYTAAIADDRQSFAEAWVASAVTGVGASLRATASGVVSFDAGAGTLTFFERLGVYPIGDLVLHDGGVLSPSQRWLVRASTDGVIQLSELAREGEPTLTSEPGTCTEIVAWSPRVQANGAERFACRQGGTLKIFDFATRLELVREEPFAATLTGARRAFSDSGRWLVLSELEPQSRRIALLDVEREGGGFDMIAASCCTVMQLAPSRDALALTSERLLIEYPLSSSEGQRVIDLSGQTTPAPPCEEDFLRDPARWCGAPHVNNQLEYSAEGQNLLIEWPQGTLSIADMTSFSRQVDATALRVTDAIPSCASCPSKPYAFSR